ncbi:MAG TPA: S9 family peptidase [Steroidobacteraceae bacterium]|nr:S9 family peptidase [Steroidobacteraceae bacterium]
MRFNTYIHRLAAVAALSFIAAPLLAQTPVAAATHEERGNLILENIPAIDPDLAARLDRYLHAREANFLDWLPDGSMLVSTRFGDTTSVHRVSSPLGMREQLTFDSEPVNVAVAPHVGAAEGFAFLKDQGGDENAQVYYYRLADRSVKALTAGKAIHGSPVWSPDGLRLAFYGNERDGVSYDIYIADVGSESAPQLVVGGQGNTWYPLDWSADGSKLLLLQYVSITESYLYLADVASGMLTPLDTSGHKIGVRLARFAPDGRGVYFVSDETGEFAELRYLDLVTHQRRDLTSNIAADVERVDVSADGRYLAYTTNDEGVSRLTVLDTVRKLELSPPGLPAGTISALRFDLSGRQLALSVDSPQSPRDVYVFDVDTGALTRWTHSEPGPLPDSSFVPARLVHFPTWDRTNGGPRMLSAYVYTPSTPGPHPVVIDIHGGPESQYRPEFDLFAQFLVNELGYAVVAPNVRGSSGYGKSFLALDNGRLREDSVRDIGSLIVWIGLQKQFNRDRIAVMGGSYGGYMALASLAAYGDRLRGGIDLVGITNFVSFLENTSAYRRDLRRVEYGDERNRDMRTFLYRISPLTNVKALRKPLLVVAGLNDPRVPPSESQALVAQLRDLGRDVWYLAAKDEGHGFRKKANRDVYLATAAQFLARLAQ